MICIPAAIIAGTNLFNELVIISIGFHHNTDGQGLLKSQHAGLLIARARGSRPCLAAESPIGGRKDQGGSSGMSLLLHFKEYKVDDIERQSKG